MILFQQALGVVVILCALYILKDTIPKIENDSELEISFSASIGQDDPSQCYISYNGRQVANHGTRHIGSMELWDVPLTEGIGG